MPSYAGMTYDQLWTIIFRNPLDGAEADYVLGEVRAARDSFGFGLPGLEEPLTYDKVRDYVASKSGTFNDKATIAKIYRDGLTSGRLPSMVADADRAVADATLPGGWVERHIRSIIQTVTDPAVWKTLQEIDLSRWTDWDAADWDRTRSAAVNFITDPKGPLQKYLSVHGDALAILVETMIGADIPGGTMRGIIDGSITKDDKKALGNITYGIIRDDLSVETVAKGWLDREPGNPEVENLKQLFGSAMRVQLGAFLVRAIQPLVPKNVGRFLEHIVDVVDKSVNLDDAIEEQIQAVIEPLIRLGATAQLNRAIKHADLSATEALQAAIAGKISEQTLTKILNNAGYRDDIRQILRDNAAGNLTESDLDKGYQWNLLTREDVKKRYRDRAFEEPDAEIKTKLVEMERRQKLREKVFELYGNLYRDGVATKQEVTPFLESYGYDADEVEMWFQVQELERRQRKWLSNGQIEDLLKNGLANVEWAIDYQVIQGMLPEDATMVYMSYLLEKYKKDLDEDCTQVLKDAASPAKMIGFLLGKLPEFGLAGMFGKSELEKVLNCLLTNTTKAP